MSDTQCKFNAECIAKILKELIVIWKTRAFSGARESDTKRKKVAISEKSKSSTYMSRVFPPIFYFDAAFVRANLRQAAAIVTDRIS